MIKGYSYQTLTGSLTLLEEEGYLVEIRFGKDGETKEEYKIEETAVIEKTFRQLEEYFQGRRQAFDVPLRPRGTEFQRQVWAALLDIPYGETWSYKDLAMKIQRRKAFRAVGMANNKNPLPIIIPCHRVIGSDGKLVGYGGGLKVKEKLLDLEKSVIH